MLFRSNTVGGAQSVARFSSASEQPTAIYSHPSASPLFSLPYHNPPTIVPIVYINLVSVPVPRFESIQQSMYVDVANLIHLHSLIPNQVIRLHPPRSRRTSTI